MRVLLKMVYSEQKLKSTSQNNFKDRIYTIRGVQVMLDRDLADLYGIQTKNLKGC